MNLNEAPGLRRIDDPEKARVMAEAEERTRQKTPVSEKELTLGDRAIIDDNASYAGAKYELEKINLGERTNRELTTILYAIEREIEDRNLAHRKELQKKRRIILLKV
jgi:hypothetical protein